MKENAFLNSAREGRNEVWRYLLTGLLSFGLFILVQVGVVLMLVLATGKMDMSILNGMGGLIATLLPFVFWLVGLWVGVKFLHRRPFLHLVNPSGRFNWRLMAFSAGGWLVLSVLGDLIQAILQPGLVVWNFNPQEFLPYAVVSLLLIPVQASTEELVFRGYLTQGLGLLTRRTVVLLVVPALVFGLLHIANPEVGAYGMVIMMANYIGMGLLLGWVTLRSEGLEMAIGIHIINNLYASLLVTFPSSALPAPALFAYQGYNPGVSLLVFGIMVALFLSVYERQRRRKTAAPAVVPQQSE